MMKWTSFLVTEGETNEPTGTIQVKDKEFNSFVAQACFRRRLEALPVTIIQVIALVV